MPFSSHTKSQNAVQFTHQMTKCRSVHTPNDKMPFSSHTKWQNEWSGGHEGRFSRNPIPVFSAGDPYEQFWHGQGCLLFDVVHQAFPLRSRSCPPALVPWRMVIERVSWCVTCPNHASFPVLTVARRASCGPTRELILLWIQSLVVSRQYIVMHATLTARYFSCANFYSCSLFTCIFSKTSPDFFLC